MKKALPETSAIALSWYEATLPLQERKQRGHFSTPAPLVERILDACGYTDQHNLASLRVLDPACGSGNFLIAAARRLLAFAERAGYTREERVAFVQSNIWGFDPDPIACFLAEMHLSETINAISPISHLRLHIHQSDVLSLPWEPRVDLFLANPPYLAAKNVDLSGYRSAQKRGQADSYLLFLSLGMQVVRPNGWLGLVLPDPLLARANAANERAQLLREFTIHHLWHLSGIFAAQVGAVVIIAQKTSPKSIHQIAWMHEKWDAADKVPTNTIPQAHFSRQPRAEFRYLSRITHDTLLDRLCCLHESELADVHTTPRFLALGNLLSIHRGEELGRKNWKLISSRSRCVGADLSRPGVEQQGISSGMDVGVSAAPPLEQRRISSGMDVGVSAAPPLEQRRISSGMDVGVSAAPPLGAINRPLRTQDREDQVREDDHFPLLRGGIDIRPYAEPIGIWAIAREHIAKPLDRYLAPKLLVVKSTAQLQAALDLRGHVVLQTLYMLSLKENHAASSNDNIDDLYFFLALLNSRLLREYVYVQYTAYKWVQPQIEQHVLANLPIPLITSEQKQDIIERARRLVALCSCSQPDAVVEWDEMLRAVYADQERAIRALYDAALR
jgi:SAM-dependent methyltransferase